jgi:hypothetical protein
MLERGDQQTHKRRREEKFPGFSEGREERAEE